MLAQRLPAYSSMHSEGLEPPTLGSEDRCSIQLSYECRRFGIIRFSVAKSSDPPLTNFRLLFPTADTRANTFANLRHPVSDSPWRVPSLAGIGSAENRQ